MLTPCAVAQRITVLSWMLVRAPIVMAASPAFSVLLNQMLADSAAIRRPVTTAVLAMNTEACTSALALRTAGAPVVGSSLPGSPSIVSRRSATSPAASARAGLAGLPA